MANKHEKLAWRLVGILTKLNSGERINIKDLANEYDVSIRTIVRDIQDRFAFLDWEENNYPFYRLNLKTLGHFTKQDIKRFAQFASVSNLLPKIDYDFFAEKLLQSVLVKGFQYENISHLQKEFSCLKNAIEHHRIISFSYKKHSDNKTKFYQITPYALLNKNGIWYLIGTDNGKQKTFCFTQMSFICILEESFIPDAKLQNEIQTNDSISHGNQIKEVVIQVSKTAAPYFLRRNLLPNQELVRQLDDGGLILASQNVNEMDIIPLVQYWIPHLLVISPGEMQKQIEEKLYNYLNIEKT